MVIIESNSIGEAYGDVVKTLLTTKNQIGQTYEINNCILVVHNPTVKHEICFPYRTKKTSLKYADAELRWYWSGDNSCHTIGKYAKMWLSLSDDGETNNSAYGYILQKKYGYNQIEQVIELLKKDPTTRRATLNISDPTLNRITTKDMQCTIAIDFMIRNGQLEETVIMRSNDIRTGTNYDMIFFVGLGEYIAKRLNIKLGLYTHHAISMHMYLKDLEAFDLSLKDYDKLTIDTEQIIKECYKYEN